MGLDNENLKKENELLRKEVLRLRSRLQAAEDAAYRDPLTGLVNRTPLLTALAGELSLTQRGGKPVGGILFLDLDGFKKINDTMGHAAGDAILQAVAKILFSQVRGEDIPSRFGGDEFVVLLRGISAPAQIKKAGERITAAIRRSRNIPLGVSVSVGGALVSPLFQEAEEVIKAADRAMYAAKRSGGNTVVVEDDCNGNNKS